MQYWISSMNIFINALANKERYLRQSVTLMLITINHFQYQGELV